MHRTLRCSARLCQVHRTHISALRRRGLTGAATSSLPTYTPDPVDSALEVPSQSVIPTPNPDADSAQASVSSEPYVTSDVLDSARRKKTKSEGKKSRCKKGKMRLEELQLQPRRDGSYEFTQQEVAQTLDLDDLVKMLPKKSDIPGVEGARYRKLYESVTKKVDGSFTQRQLFQLMQKMELEGRGTAPRPVEKKETIRRILNDHWGMPEPPAAESRQILTHSTSWPIPLLAEAYLTTDDLHRAAYYLGAALPSSRQRSVKASCSSSGFHPDCISCH